MLFVINVIARFEQHTTTAHASHVDENYEWLQCDLLMRAESSLKEKRHRCATLLNAK